MKVVAVGDAGLIGSTGANIRGLAMCNGQSTGGKHELSGATADQTRAVDNAHTPGQRLAPTRSNERHIHGKPSTSTFRRYALQVGAIDVLVVSDEVLSLPADLGHDVDPAERPGWRTCPCRRTSSSAALNVVVVRIAAARPYSSTLGSREPTDLRRGRMVWPATRGRRHRSRVRD